MICYNCGCRLSEQDFCTGCGADVSLYKKVIYLSNRLYNDGLDKASVRDLSGAIASLKESIKLNKNNIDARNLLGLVYFEMGEAVSALGEWVISQNLRPKKNIANDYIDMIQNNQARLDGINQTIKKYNQALAYCWQDSQDLAVIQLKKVLSNNPKYVRAHQLLALLYMNTEEWEKARAFNSSFTDNNLYGDVFGAEDTKLEDTEYWKVLNIAGDGVMGYLSIPKINIKLAIYHGTGEDVLQTGVGHLNGTKLPIGGEGSHSVLAAHRGLPSARLFTDIDQLQPGDKFYIHMLDEVLAYEVDQILPMVEKDDMETLTEAMKVDPDADQVTLFTCTPYGVNSHRLLVRGTRVPYTGEEEAQNTVAETMVQAVQNYYMLYLIMGLSVTILVILIMKFLFGRHKKQGGKRDDE